MSKLKRVLTALAVVFCFGAVWAADAPTITVDGTTVTINNETASTYASNDLTINATWQSKGFWLPTGTDLAANKVVKITSIAFAVPSGKNFADKIGLAGCVSASAVRTADGFATAGADKVLFSFKDSNCFLVAGSSTQIWFLDSNGDKVAATTSVGFRTGAQSYQHIDSLVWSGSAPVIEVVGEIMSGSLITGTQTAIGNTGSDPLYASGVTGWLDTENSKTGPVVLIGNNDGTASIGVNNANSVNETGRHSVWSKLSGSGTLTSLYTSSVGDKSGTSPVLEVYDSSEFTGSIVTPVSQGPKLSVVFCNSDESETLKTSYYNLFYHSGGSNPASIYVSAGRTTANNAVVTIPANKTWTANKLLNNGEVVVDGTFTGPVANTGTLTVNGTVTGTISNNGGTVILNEGATVSSFGSQRDFTGFTASVPVKITMTAEEYGKGSVSVTGAAGISSITVLAPDGTTEVTTLTPENGEAAYERGSVLVSGKACWVDYEMNGNRTNAGTDATDLQQDGYADSAAFYNNSTLYTYTHPFRNNLAAYPANWTAVVRCTVPNLANAAIITFGNQSAGLLGLIAGDDPEKQMKLVQTTGNSAYETKATMDVLDATSAQHVYVFAVENNQTLKCWCDGSLVLNETLESPVSIGAGFQIGSVVYGVGSTGIVRWWPGDAAFDALTPAVQAAAQIDCLRLYDYILSAEQISALSAEFPAVKLYRATAAADANTAWGSLSWAPAWDGGNNQSKVILTTEGDATIALPETITADEVELILATDSTLTLSGPGSLEVTKPITIGNGTLVLTEEVTLTQNTAFNGKVSFAQFTKAGDGAIQLSSGATVGVDAALVVTPLGAYTLADGTVVDATYAGDGVRLMPLSSASASLTTSAGTVYYPAGYEGAFNAFAAAVANDETAVLTILDGTDYSGYAGTFVTLGYHYDQAAGTLAKAVAKVAAANKTYMTLVGAVSEVEAEGQVELLRASTEAITLNKAITLKETASYNGTLSGTGALTLTTLRTAAITFGEWTGTVSLPANIEADGLNLNFYGKEGSVVVVNGVTGGWLASAAITPTVELAADFTISSFSPSFGNAINTLKGTGAFAITAEANEGNDLANVENWSGGKSSYSAYFRIGNVAEFTGSLSTSADVGIVIGAEKPACNTVGGKILLTTTATIAADATWTAPNGIVLGAANAVLTVTDGELATAPTTTVENSEIVMATGAGNAAIYSVVEQPTVTVTTPVNGTIVVTQGDATVASGSRVSTLTPVVITITPAENYEIDDDSEDLAITMGGVDITENIDKEEVGTVVTATIPSVTGDLSITIPFKLSVKTFTVTIPDNTAISVQGATLVEGNTYTAQIGAEVTITYTAVGNYVVKGGSQTIEVTAGTETVNKPEGMTVNPAVAQIGADLFETIQEAVDQGDVTVKILGDVTLTGKLIVDGGQTVVLTADSAVTVTGQLRVVDGSSCTIEENVTFTSASHPTVFVLGDPAVKTAGTAPSTLVVNGKVLNTNATFDQTFAIAGNGYDTQGVSVTIGAKGEVLNANGLAIYKAFPGSLVINGTVVGASAISIKDGTLTVNEGAVITATLADGLDYVGNNSGETPTGDAIIAPYYPLSKGYGTPVVSILGGTITVTDTTNCTGIEAYDFDGVVAPDDSATNVNVSGGLFNTPVAEVYCASGFIPCEVTGGYSVKTGAYVAQVVGGAKYETFDAAVEAAGNTGNTVIELLANTTYKMVNDQYLSIKAGEYTFNVSTDETDRLVASRVATWLGEGIITYWVSPPRVEVLDGETKVGGYLTLQEAVDAAEAGQTLRLRMSVEVESPVVINKNLTIDLYDGNPITSTTTRTLWVKEGTLTLTGTGSISSTANSDSRSSVIRLGVNNYADASGPAGLVIGENVKILAGPNPNIKCYGVTYFGVYPQTVVVNGEIVSNGPALGGNGTARYAASTVTVNGLAASYTDYAIYNPQAGTTTINGRVSGVGGGIEVKGGTVNITATATVESTSESLSHSTDNDGTSTSGYAIAAVGNSAYKQPAVVNVADGATVTGTVCIFKENGSETYGIVKSAVNTLTIPEGFTWGTASEGYYTLAVYVQPPAIDPTDPTSAQEVVVDPTGKTEAEIKEAAIAETTVTIPEAVATATEVTEETYKGYFNYTVTDKGNGVYEVTVDPVKDLNEEVVLPESATTATQETITQTEELLEAATSDEIEAATVPAVPGIYYSMVAANNLGFEEAVEGDQTLATGSTVTIAKPEQLPTGDAVFFRVKASATPNSNN